MRIICGLRYGWWGVRWMCEAAPCDSVIKKKEGTAVSLSSRENRRHQRWREDKISATFAHIKLLFIVFIKIFLSRRAIWPSFRKKQDSFGELRIAVTYIVK